MEQLLGILVAFVLGAIYDATLSPVFTQRFRDWWVNRSVTSRHTTADKLRAEYIRYRRLKNNTQSLYLSYLAEIFLVGNLVLFTMYAGLAVYNFVPFVLTLDQSGIIHIPNVPTSFVTVITVVMAVVFVIATAFFFASFFGRQYRKALEMIQLSNFPDYERKTIEQIAKLEGITKDEVTKSLANIP